MKKKKGGEPWVGKTEPPPAISAERCSDQPRTEAVMLRTPHLRSALLGPYHREFAGAVRNVSNFPRYADAAEGRAERAVFFCVRGKLMKHKVQRQSQGRFKIKIGPGSYDLTGVSGVRMHG